MQQYKDLINHILAEGTIKDNRTGVRTISTFNYNYTVDLTKGFPLLTTKKINWKAIIFELLWFMSGSNNLKFLHKYGVHFWDGWDTGNGETATQYHNLVAFPNILNDGVINQIDLIVKEIMENSFSRRLVMTAWHPEEAFAKVKGNLPPCHIMSIFNVQVGKDGIPELNLHLTQRSGDSGIGIPYNLASYSLLLSIISWITGIRVGKFAHSIVDAHIYIGRQDGDEYDHRPALTKQLERECRELPVLIINADQMQFTDWQDKYRYIFEYFTSGDALEKDILEFFTLQNYNPHPFILMKAVV